MTLDEAIKRFNNNAEYERSHGSLQGCLEFRQLAEWLAELKELKEQTEPCEDCISRQRVLDTIDSYMAHHMGFLDLKLYITELPSVQPEPKMGHWIERRNRATGHIESVCSECGAEEGYPYNIYCGNCGTKMEWG